ncbi:hypothetical protein QMK33_11285 [Hymenobacter sp. H14-R3]|uniref:hypothetical protein n=1 Tax=Hymenobacter sp. H14-R3 TaxID=3046308 RepID=UPI0024BA6C15|nr:hypothetical protein [Hymenobacter sp. H14-R3]MDJ0365736.1 hypothetical protein [Hymenobacter sp. H14-R3]
MKFNSLPALASLSLLAMSTSCEKSTITDPTPAAVSENSISGEWEWVKTVGGLTGNQNYTPSSTGVATIWVFKPDSTFQQYDTRQGVTQLTESTTFSVRSARSIYNGQITQTLRINHHVSGGSPSTSVIQPITYLIEELGAELKIADNYADGFSQTYRRK